MKVLLDHNLPKQLIARLPGHQVFTARQMRWDRLTNGVLLAVAENEHFHVLITADKGLYSQQNHRDRVISLIVLDNNKLLHLDPQQTQILAAIERATPGSYELVPIPLPPKMQTDSRAV